MENTQLQADTKSKETYKTEVKRIGGLLEEAKKRNIEANLFISEEEQEFWRVYKEKQREYSRRSYAKGMGGTLSLMTKNPDLVNEKRKQAVQKHREKARKRRKEISNKIANLNAAMKEDSNSVTNEDKKFLEDYKQKRRNQSAANAKKLKASKNTSERSSKTLDSQDTCNILTDIYNQETDTNHLNVDRTSKEAQNKQLKKDKNNDSHALKYKEKVKIISKAMKEDSNSVTNEDKKFLEDYRKKANDRRKIYYQKKISNVIAATKEDSNSVTNEDKKFLENHRQKSRNYSRIYYKEKVGNLIAAMKKDSNSVANEDKKFLENYRQKEKNYRRIYYKEKVGDLIAAMKKDPNSVTNEDKKIFDDYRKKKKDYQKEYYKKKRDILMQKKKNNCSSLTEKEKKILNDHEKENKEKENALLVDQHNNNKNTSELSSKTPDLQDTFNISTDIYNQNADTNHLNVYCISEEDATCTSKQADKGNINKGNINKGNTNTHSSDGAPNTNITFNNSNITINVTNDPNQSNEAQNQFNESSTNNQLFQQYLQFMRKYRLESNQMTEANEKLNEDPQSKLTTENKFTRNPNSALPPKKRFKLAGNDSELINSKLSNQSNSTLVTNLTTNPNTNQINLETTQINQSIKPNASSADCAPLPPQKRFKLAGNDIELMNQEHDNQFNQNITGDAANNPNLFFQYGLPNRNTSNHAFKPYQKN